MKYPGAFIALAMILALLFIYLGPAIPLSLYALLVPTVLAAWRWGRMGGLTVALFSVLASLPATLRAPAIQANFPYPLALVLAAGWLLGLLSDERRRRLRLSGAAQRLSERVSVAVDVEAVWRSALSQMVTLFDAAAGAWVWRQPIDEVWTVGESTLTESDWKQLSGAEDLSHAFWRRNTLLAALNVRDVLRRPVEVAPWEGCLILVGERATFSAPAAGEVDALLEVTRQAALGQLRYARADLVLARQLQESRTLRDLSQLTGESLDLDETLQAVLRAFAELIAYDIGEITYWDPEQEVLVRGAIVGREETVAYLSEGSGVYALDEGMSGWLARTGEPVLVDDLRDFSEARPKNDTPDYPMRSYLGIPLVARGDLVGTLEVSAFESGAFTPHDLELARSLGAQAAVAIEKARLYSAARRRVKRLEQLSDVAQAAGRAADLPALFEEIVNHVSQILEAGIVGVLLYDAEHRRLVARAPFLGIPEAWLKNYILHLPEGKGFEDLWGDAPFWIIGDAQSDRVIEERGLLPLAMATDMRQTLLAPLEAGGQLVGLIQVSNPQERQPFDDTDGRLLTMLTAQLSGMVRISQLLENMENRTQQMGSLVSVATAIGASLDLESVLDTIVEAASEVLGAQRTGIFVLDAANNVLNLVAARGVSDRYRRLSQAVPIMLHGRSHAVAANEMVIAEDVLAEAEFAEVAPLAGSEGFRAFADVPLRRGEQPVGLLTVQFTEPHYFDEDEENLLHILAEQAAVAIENARLYEQTGEELHLRIESLEALQRVTREITLTLDLDRILALVLSEAVHFREVDAGFVLFWHESGAPELRGFSGYSEEEITDLRDLLNDPEKRYPLRDFLAQPEMRYFEDLAEYGGVSLPLPQACSLILAPVLYQERLTATIVIQNRQPRAFSPATLEFVEGLAAQTSIAVGNAERYQDQMERGELMRKRAEQARLFLEVSRTMRSDRPLDDILLDMAYATQEASGFEIVMISILQGGMTQRAAAAGVPLTEFERMKEVRQPWARISSLMRDEFRLGQCYYIPAERQHIWRGDLDVFEERISKEERSPGMWHPQDLLIVPLQTTQGDYLGYMSVDRPLDERAPTRISVEILELFAAQIALAIENSRLVENLRLQLNTVTLFNELNRSITTKLDLSLVLNTVVQAVTNLLDYDYATIFLQERESGRFVPLASSGYAVELLADISFARGEGLVGSVIQSGMPLVLEDAQSDRRFAPGPVEIGSSVLVPLTAEGHPVGVLAADRKETGDFMPTEVATLTAVADQVSVAVENARLFEEVKRFSVEMEQRVEERTEELADALDELRDEQDRTELLYRIASELVASLDIDRVLNKALALLRDAVDAARGSVLLLDSDTGYLYYRAAIGAEWSVPPGGIRSKLSRDEGLVGWVMKRRRSVVISDVYEDDRWVAREDDATRSVLAVPVLGGEGQANGAIFLHAYTADAFSEDDRRLVEAAAIQLGNALNNAELYRLIREQTERLGTMLRAQQIEAVKSEAILEGIADGVMVADAQGRITLFNAAAERILSISRSQATGRMVDEMLGLYGLKAQEWLTEVRKWQKNPASYETGDFLAERLELEKRVVSVHLSPVISQSHEFLGMVSVFRDVTAEVEADRAKSDFVSTVSHELRTPMTAIKGYVDLLLMGTTGDLTKMQAQFLEVVRTNADRLTALVNDLLDLSRIETGKIVLNPRPLDMGNVIEQAVMTIAPKAREKGLVARDVVPEGLPKVYGDPDRVFQILTNLLGNAFKYTPIGGEISVHAYIRDAMMHVAITDTGIGISREDQESIFDRFFRVDDPLVQEESGTGLGLSITASLVKMQGGEIFVESEPGEGSIFTFTLPLAEGEQTESVGRPPEDFVLIRPVKILVVDDDAEVAELLRLTLASEDREVLVATTGEEALHLAREQRPDLISLDIRLPDLDGFELLQLLKREPETAEIPVIIVSVVEDVQRGLDLGAVDYLTKPIDEGRLRQVVDDALSNRNLVLVVDDDYQILVTMREALRAQGLGVRTTGRGARALKLARRLRPALLLLDLSLPDLDGHRVLDNLRQNPHTGDIPVIVMMESEGDDSGSLSRGIERRGGLRSISKPFSPQQLAEEITLLVNGRDADKE